MFEALRVRRELAVAMGILEKHDITLVQLPGEFGVAIAGRIYTAPCFEDVLAMFVYATRDSPLKTRYPHWYACFEE
jgi:hypothetical protein